MTETRDELVERYAKLYDENPNYVMVNGEKCYLVGTGSECWGEETVHKFLDECNAVPPKKDNEKKKSSKSVKDGDPSIGPDPELKDDE